MNIQSKQFNWVKTPSAWDSLQSWRARRSAMTQQFLDDTSAVSSITANNLSV